MRNMSGFAKKLFPFIVHRSLFTVYSLLLLLPLSLFAAGTTVTLDDLVATALKKSPDLQSARLDVEAAKMRLKSAKAGYLPRLDLTANTGGSTARFKGDISQDAALLAGRLSVSQLLWDFGKTGGTVEAAEALQKASGAALYQRVSDKILEVKEAYYAVLKAKSLVRVRQKGVELRQQQLYRAQKYLKAGIRTIIDVSDAKVELARARRDLQNVRFDVQRLRAALERAVGGAIAEGAYRLAMPDLVWERLAERLPPVPSNLQALTGFAWRHRFAIESLKHRARSEAARIRAVEGEYLPTIGLEADAGAQYVDDDLAMSLPENDARGVVALRWNLFEGFRSDARLEEAKALHLKAVSEVQRLKLTVQEEVTEAWLALKRSEENVRLDSVIAHTAREKLHQASKRYENGLADFLELKSAQQDYIAALAALVNSYFDTYIALARLDHAVGR
ncbi:TolC family protein [Hydrogenimonas sp. SS33]|uniref:TolC family protein n=1 Tax=Hydrogenimonas leucolamina TaxID=2954236 RepID=UPI00336BE17E